MKHIYEDGDDNQFIGRYEGNSTYQLYQPTIVRPSTLERTQDFRPVHVKFGDVMARVSARLRLNARRLRLHL